MAREVSPDATVCCDLNIHGAVMGSHQSPRFWLPEAYSLHKEFKPHPVTPIRRSKRPQVNDLRALSF